MRPTTLLVLLLVALCACDDRSDAPRPEASAAPRAASFASLAGQPIPFASILAYSRGGAAVHILASTHELGCGELAGAGYVRESGELTLELTLSPTLGGEPGRFRLTRARMGSTTRQGDLGSVETTAIDPRRAVKARLAGKTTFGSGPSARELRLDGLVEAQGCGIISTSGAEARPQPELALSLGGRSVPVRGASYEVASRILRLSSEPHSCTSGLEESDLALSLTLDEAPAVAQAKIEGFALERTASTKAEGLTHSAEGLEDADEITFELAGTLSIGGHPLELEGRALAARCAPR